MNPPPAHPPRTVLVVDDRAVDRRLLRTLLEYRGYRVVEAADGAEALRLVADDPPALVISDVLLPGIGGYELVLRLRADPAAAEIPVVLCSAHFGPWETAGSAAGLGAAAVVAKPLEPDDLFRAVDAALAGGDVPVADAPVPAELVELLTRKLFRKVQQLELLSGDRRALLGTLVRGQEHERQRVATTLEDDAAPALAGAAAALELLARHQPDPGRAAAAREIAADLAAAGRRLTSLASDFQPPTTEGRTVAGALRAAVDRAAAAGNLAGTVEGSLSCDLPPEQFTVVYRIAQEALDNVVRHAGATRVAVTVDDRAGGVLVRIEDDGAGLPGDGAAPARPGLGLTAMRERADVAGGWWRIDSPPDRPGTTVEFWIPRHAT